MCLSPLHIRLTKSRYFNLDHSLLAESDVPCGHCEQCQITAKNDLFLRTRAEYYDCVNSGGVAIFLTFTYDEDNVPYFYYSLDDDGIISLTKYSRRPFNRFAIRPISLRQCSDKIKKFVVPDSSNTLMCFDKSHITNYLKRLRSSIEKDYELTGALRYICVSEYGSQFTQRPHYHAIFFLRCDLVSRMFPDGLYGSIDNSNHLACELIMRRFSQHWPYGMVSASKAGLFVNSESCMSYVTKYICKNTDLLSYSRFQQFFDFICEAYNSKPYHFVESFTRELSQDPFDTSCDSNGDFGERFVLRTSYVQDPRYRGRLMLPYGHDFNSPMSFFLYYCRLFDICFYTVKSQFFGASMLDDFHNLDVPSTLKKLNVGVAHTSAKSGKTNYLSYPKYIRKKLFYNNRGDGTYYLNSRGLETINALRIDSINKFTKSVKDFDWSILDTIPITYFKDNFKYVFSPRELSKMRELLPLYASKVFALSSLLRGRAFDSVSYSYIRAEFNNYFYDRITLDSFIERISSILVDDNPITYCLPSDSETLGDFLEYDFDGPLFYFDTADDITLYILADFWTCITNFCRGSLLHEYEIERKSQKKLRDILNSRLYGIP